MRLPYTVGLVATGLALALARLPLDLALTHDVLFEVILPPLLFEAALSISWRELKGDLAPVLALSTIGVLVGAGVVAGGLVWALNWPFTPALAFGALIAATDPIAVIAMLREAGVKGRLRLVVESESLFNDGAAALLFALILPMLTLSGAPTPLTIAGQALLIGGGGVAIGEVRRRGDRARPPHRRPSGRDGADDGRRLRRLSHRRTRRRFGRAGDGRRRIGDGQPRRAGAEATAASP